MSEVIKPVQPHSDRSAHCPTPFGEVANHDVEILPVAVDGAANQGAELNPGAIVANRYRILSTIARGGMGTVYRCEQIFIGKEIALKVLDSRNVSAISLRRFQQEAKAVFAVEHPNLIAVHDFGLTEDQVPFLSMDLVRGKSLAEHIKIRGSFSVEECLPIFLRICFGLAYAHENGVVHRDIKPSNIMLLDDRSLNDEDCLRIIDFGIAKFTQSENFDLQTMTKTGDVVGSPLYMSPEQCMGTAVDRRSDIYSLGCVLFECLTGTPPFLGLSALSTMMRHAHEATPSLKEASLGKEFPQSIEKIVAKMLNKEASRRYQNLAEVIEDLTALRQGFESGCLLAPQVNSQARAAVDAKEITLSVRCFCVLAAMVIVTTAVLSFLVCRHYLNTCSQQAHAPALSRDEISANQIFNSSIVDLLDRGQAIGMVESSNFLARPVESYELEKLLSQRSKRCKVGLKFRTISNEDIRKIGNTSWVASIDFGHSRISNSGLRHLARLKLIYITVSHTNLDDSGADWLSKCQSLRSVEVGNTAISEVGVASLLHLRNLFSLDLESTKITAGVLEKISQCKSLRRLDLRGIKAVNDDSIKSLTGGGLLYLGLENTSVTDACIATLSSMPYLGAVDIGRTNISAAALEELLKNSRIKSVFCLSCPKIKEADWERLKAEFSGVNFIQERNSGD